jgi:hypothetical protein
MFGENLFEVLMHYGEKELLESRWLGKRKIDELKKILKQYGCQDLLSE